MTPADIEQIVDAIDRLPWAQWAKGKMAAEMGPGAGAIEPPGPTSGEPAASPPAGVGGDRPTPPVAPPAADSPKEDEAEKQEFAALKKHYEADEQYKRYSGLAKKYAPKTAAGDAAMWAQVDDAGAGRSTKDGSYHPSEMEGEWHKKMSADDSDEGRRNREEYSRIKKKYGGDASGEYQQVPAGGGKKSAEIPAGGANIEGGAAAKEPEKKDYAAGGSADGTDVHKPAESSVDTASANRSAAAGTAGQDGGTSSEPYARTGEIERYRREMSDLRKELETERGARVNSERYSRLQALRMGCAFDVDQAFELVKYGRASDEQFQQQIELIKGSARAIPIGSDYLPTEDHRAVEGSRERGGGQRQQLGKYSRAHSDQAFRICEERAKCGKSADYVAVVQAIAEGRQPVFAD